ncbi:hypothetical protein LX69_00217 [Breznakibacter xylanolyticus]|uniref:Gliding motility-associated lipoprotein GldB n=1 Tax=Breznakibacter xylanolyticus TaxID=990 RepID=A0A2W7PBT2_9BACT|nr:gliding motility protein GldB [Breznakibacter xylanolyticus]PZX20792.1 hypothetical protein LX69_00217 [Breznakibacter xylanolyticus]
MKHIKIFLLIVTFAGGWYSCRKGPDVSSVTVDFRLIPFYESLHGTPLDSIEARLPMLRQTYGRFFDAYCMGVIRVGDVDAPDFALNLKSFLDYPPNKEVYDTCKVAFADLTSLQAQMHDAFRHYRYYFEDAIIPDVYLHLSGFNQSMVVDSGFVGVSIEKYLGESCVFYEWLSYPVYLRRKMVPQKLVPDLMKAIAMTEFPYNDSVDDVLNHMVYQGKVAWFVQQMVPEIHDSLLFDYSEYELEWCNDHESQMWSTMVENKHLFSTDRMLIQKYTGDAPFTAHFGQDSPGHAAIFIGYRLIQSFVSQHKHLTLRELMSQSDARLILSRSAYRP